MSMDYLFALTPHLSPSLDTVGHAWEMIMIQPREIVKMLVWKYIFFFLFIYLKKLFFLFLSKKLNNIQNKLILTITFISYHFL
jgi:hypothetical protein